MASFEDENEEIDPDEVRKKAIEFLKAPEGATWSDLDRFLKYDLDTWQNYPREEAELIERKAAEEKREAKKE